MLGVRLRRLSPPIRQFEVNEFRCSIGHIGQHLCHWVGGLRSIHQNISYELDQNKRSSNIHSLKSNISLSTRYSHLFWVRDNDFRSVKLENDWDRYD